MGWSNNQQKWIQSSNNWEESGMPVRTSWRRYHRRYYRQMASIDNQNYIFPCWSIHTVHILTSSPFTNERQTAMLNQPLTWICEARCVGQTTRRLSECIKEDKPSLLNKRLKTIRQIAISTHLRESDHLINKSEASRPVHISEWKKLM